MAVSSCRPTQTMKRVVSRLTNVTPVLCSWHVTIDPEPPINAPHRPSTHGVRHERLHTIPQLIVERLIDNPVEVVCENARIFALRPHWCVRNELHGLACADDG